MATHSPAAGSLCRQSRCEQLLGHGNSWIRSARVTKLYKKEGEAQKYRLSFVLEGEMGITARLKKVEEGQERVEAQLAGIAKQLGRLADQGRI